MVARGWASRYGSTMSVLLVMPEAAAAEARAAALEAIDTKPASNYRAASKPMSKKAVAWSVDDASVHRHRHREDQPNAALEPCFLADDTRAHEYYVAQSDHTERRQTKTPPELAKVTLAPERLVDAVRKKAAGHAERTEISGCSYT